MNERTQLIARLNDLCRTAIGITGRLAQTDGIRAMSQADQSRIRELVETFDDFNDANNPHGERDFGAFDYKARRVFWKIDYYDKALTYGSDDPSDASRTLRVLTIMLASEY